MPPGADQLGPGGIFPNLTIQDAIQSSVSTFKKYGYTYNATEHFIDNTENSFHDMALDPKMVGAHFTGIFSIPVCDVGNAANSSFKLKQYILQDYGHESRPKWCGNICNGDAKATADFYHAANMDNFKSPTHGC